MIDVDEGQIADAVSAAKRMVAALQPDLTELERAAAFGVVLAAMLGEVRREPVVNPPPRGQRGKQRERGKAERTADAGDPGVFTYDAERYPEPYQLAKLPAIERVLWVMVVEKMEGRREPLSAPKIADILTRSIGLRTGAKTVDEALKRELQKRTGVSRVSRVPKGRGRGAWKWQVTRAGEEHVMSAQPARRGGK